MIPADRMVTAGLAPMDALRSAAYKPAEFLGLLDSMGTIQSGKSAEVVLLDANPLADISNTTKILTSDTSRTPPRGSSVNSTTTSMYQGVPLAV